LKKNRDIANKAGARKKKAACAAAPDPKTFTSELTPFPFRIYLVF
jgi:hypothetical protein